MIVETHIHVAAPDQVRYPRQLEGAAWGSEQEVSAEDLLALMDSAGIDKAVLVQRNRAYKTDNRYLVDAAARYPQRFGSLGIVDPLAPNAPATLSAWVREHGMQALRLYPIGSSAGQWLDDPGTFPLWERAGELGIPVAVCMRFDLMARLKRVLSRFSTIPVVLEHLGFPSFEDGPDYPAARPLFELAGHANLYLKLTTPNLYAARQTGGAQPFFQRLVNQFGARRLMWGSDFPATHDRPLADLLALAREDLGFLSGAEQHWIFGETALALWPSLRRSD